MISANIWIAFEPSNIWIAFEPSNIWIAFEPSNIWITFERSNNWIVRTKNQMFQYICIWSRFLIQQTQILIIVELENMSFFYILRPILLSFDIFWIFSIHFDIFFWFCDCSNWFVALLMISRIFLHSIDLFYLAYVCFGKENRMYLKRLWTGTVLVLTFEFIFIA